MPKIAPGDDAILQAVRNARGVAPAATADRASRALADAPEGESLVNRQALKKGRGGEQPRVDRDAGENGIIYGFSVLTRGEALGWGGWLDSEFVDETIAAGLARSPRVKSRFTHPDMSSDGLGKLLGRVTNFRRDGDQARGDLEFVKSASETPDGDLADYIMSMAEESPDLFASSIVFRRDRGAEEAFAGKHSDEDGTFTSPDRDNGKNYPHWRLASLRAADIVDEPGANPGGFFSAWNPAAVEAEKVLSFAFGLSSDAPAEPAFGVIHPERVRRTVNGFLSRHGLEITRKATGPKAHATEAEELEMEWSDVTREGLKAERPELAAGLVADGESDATQAAKVRLAELKAIAPEDPAFVLEHFEQGTAPAEAKAAFGEKRIADLETEKAKLEKKLAETPAAAAEAEAEVAPVAFDGDADVEKTHPDRAKEYQAQHGGPKQCSIRAALRATAAPRE